MKRNKRGVQNEGVLKANNFSLHNYTNTQLHNHIGPGPYLCNCVGLGFSKFSPPYTITQLHLKQTICVGPPTQIFSLGYTNICVAGAIFFSVQIDVEMVHDRKLKHRDGSPRDGRAVGLGASLERETFSGSVIRTIFLPSDAAERLRHVKPITP